MSYTANIRSIITYASPSWFFLLSEGDKNKLAKIQRTASRFILPDLSYDDRLAILELPSVCDFISTLGEQHFNKIASDPQHPLFSRVHFNTCSRISSRRIYKGSNDCNQKNTFAILQCTHHSYYSVHESFS